MEFLFKGPLIKPEKRSVELPIVPQAGWVDIATQVTIPLSDLASTRVNGTAEVRNGRGLLPEGVPVNDINGSVVFTERKVESNNVRATFLGGETRGQVVTVKQAQPPIVKLVATGVANTDALKPWVGEHLLTWFDGEALWQGSILFDQDRVEISALSNLEGISVSAPAPLLKDASQNLPLSLLMVFGGQDVAESMSIKYGDYMNVRFKSNMPTQDQLVPVSMFDNSLISVSGGASVSDSGEPKNATEKGSFASQPKLKAGVNFLVNDNNINIDDWLSAIIDLASFELSGAREKRLLWKCQGHSEAANHLVGRSCAVQKRRSRKRSD
jgi:hypothetical protein